MSKIKWGAIVVDGRGKLGGHVFTKTRSGATMRTKVTPVNPQTTAQAAARSRLGGMSQAWKALSEAQRLAWNALASETAKTNIFGDQYFPTGKNLFTGLNANKLLIGGLMMTNAPVLDEVPTIVNATAAVAIATTTLTISIDASATPEDEELVIEATRPMSAGRYNFDGSYRIVETVADVDDLAPTAQYAAYVAKFGAPAAGSKIGFRFYFVNKTTGQQSPRFACSAIVV